MIFTIWPGGRNATSFDIAATFIMQCGQIYLVGQKARAAWLANHASTKATSWNEFRKQFNRRVSQNYYIEFDKLRELPFTWSLFLCMDTRNIKQK